MDMYEIRRRNLEWLCDEYGRNIVAERLGYSDTNYLNVLISVRSKTNVGNKMAQKIEQTFQEVSSRPGWMNVPQWEVTDREAIKRVADTLPDELLPTARAILEALGQRKDS